MAIRPPAVAGMFYDVRPDRLERTVRECLGPQGPAKPPVRAAAPEAARAPAAALGAIVPHAGYVYSGPVAGAVYAAVAVPSTAVILCPNHTGRGAPLALDPSSAWRTPLGDVPVDRGLAERLLALCPSLEEDAEAHRREHSLEVQLPFLQVLRPGVRIVPISIGEPSLGLCREIGSALKACTGAGECEIRLRGEAYISLPLETISFGDGYVLRSLQSIDGANEPVRNVVRLGSSTRNYAP